MKKTLLIIVFTLVLLIIVGGVYFLATSKRTSKLSNKEKTPSVGEQIYTQTKNPLEEKLPETNPFSTETNPAKKVYPNPFDRL